MTRNRSPRTPHGGRTTRRRGVRPASAEVWFYGLHAVAAALRNPARQCLRLLATAQGYKLLVPKQPLPPEAQILLEAVEVVERGVLERALPPGAVHQGLALLVAPLPQNRLESVCAPPCAPLGAPRSTSAASAARPPVVVLDQVTDPRNIGAVLRSAAAFRAGALIMPARHAPDVTGALAKAASGAVEHIPLVRVSNLARGLETLKELGYWCVGLAAEAETELAAAPLVLPVALILGAEGAGLRRLTRERCDILVRIPIAETAASLNVSATAAVALYAVTRPLSPV